MRGARFVLLPEADLKGEGVYSGRHGVHQGYRGRLAQEIPPLRIILPLHAGGATREVLDSESAP